MTRELEKRVRTLEDIEAIRQLHTRYVYLLSNLQWDDMVQCFAEGATMELLDQGEVRGKEAISGVFHDVLAKRITPKDGHLVGQPVITVDGDRAAGCWILYLFFAEPEVRWLQGRQDCEYVRVNGEWKFQKVKFTAPWPGA
ncbi:MAG: nuclear transport factor 2 family protein [Dehalococcoidia bacterium]|jgi:hypothetical protein